MEPSSQSVPPENCRTSRELFDEAYEELRRRAHRERACWSGDLTLNTTAMVHDAYLKLVGRDHGFENTRHFLCVVSKALRQLLIDYARLRLAKKRGGSRLRVPMAESQLDTAGRVVLTIEKAEELVRLDEALQGLRQESERQADVVDCRFFAGLSITETAEALGISHATVSRDWASAQLWLYACLRDDTGVPSGTVKG